MDEVQNILAAMAAVMAAVGTLVARFQGTNSDKSFFQRLMVTFDLTQIFDTTRKLDD